MIKIYNNVYTKQMFIYKKKIYPHEHAGQALVDI